MPDIPVPVFAASGLALAIFILAALYFKNYIKVPPNMVAVFTGRGAVKIVRGGGRFRIPGIERVDYMSIEPFNIEVQIRGALSKEGVPVSIDAVALVRFGSADEIIRTAVERFLTADREKMQDQAREIVAGNLRGIIGNMTVEELIASRESLSSRVVDEAESSFGRIGMELEVLTIQQIADERGYLEALGGRRIAEVKRDAEIGEANAKRDSMIKTAEAMQMGETAQAKAAIAIANANKERDVQIATNNGAIAAEQAKADQAGPLAQAIAVKAVNIADMEAKAAAEQAGIEVEKQRALKETQSQQATVVVPAEAQREAAVLTAEAAKITTVKQAEGEAEKIKLLADAEQASMVANAAGTKAEMVATAEGTQAQLEAEAKGRRELAEALSQYDEIAQRMQLAPDLIDKLPEMAKEIAAGIGAIDRYIVFDGGGGDGHNGNGDGTGNKLNQLVTTVPVAVAATIEAFRAATGVDLGAIISQVSDTTQEVEAPKPPPGDEGPPRITSLMPPPPPPMPTDE